MNIGNAWKKLCQQAAGMKRGYQVYRQTVDAGKQLAPALPVVQDLLASRGLPVTPEAALRLLADKAASSSSLPPPAAEALRGYVGARLP